MNLDSYLRARMMCHENSSAGGVGTLDLQPGVGRIWIVLWAVCWHDDNGAARVMNWMINDGVHVAMTLPANTAALANNVLLPIYTNNNPGATPSDYSSIGWAGPIVLNTDCYAQVQVAAIGAGKKAYYKAVVMEIRGIRVWQQD